MDNLSVSSTSSSSASSNAGSGSLPPLTVKSRLAANPPLATKPKYSVPVQLSSGETIYAADPAATRAMVACMDMQAHYGGAASHYGGPAAFAELMSAVHALMFHYAQKQSQPWHELFHFINDAGHCENGLYALKANYNFNNMKLEDLKKFRSIESPLTGHGEAHVFPEGVLVSNGPLGSSLPQAQGLAMADALARAFPHRITLCALSDGAAMEGEAKEAFAAIPGLAKRRKLAPFVLLVSDNRTKLSGRIDEDAFSMEPTFSSLETLGWRVLRLQDGHNLQACVATIEEALRQVRVDSTRPVVIHAKTIKGKGHQKSEMSSTGAHGFPLKSARELPAFIQEIYNNREIPSEIKDWCQALVQYDADLEAKKASVKTVSAAAAGGTSAVSSSGSVAEKVKVQKGVAEAMIAAARAGLPVVSVSADLQGSTGVSDFHKAFPQMCFDVGVAEANMISAAAGLSLAGYIPFVDTFAQFGVTKGALPITMANLSHAPIIGIFSHVGFQDAADGASHQALSYFAQVSSIPHVEAYSLSCSAEAKALVGQAIEAFVQARKKGQTPPTRLFFLGRENFPTYWNEGETYRLGEALIVRSLPATVQPHVCIVASGSLVGEAIKAADILKSTKQIQAVVVHNSSVNRPDLKTLRPLIEAAGGHLLTVEDHRVVGGMGALLAHQLLQEGCVTLRLRSLGVAELFGRSAYQAAELYRENGLDHQAIVQSVISMLGT